MAKRKKKTLYFPREPEQTIAARIKKLGRRRLLNILGPAYKLLKTDPRDNQLAALSIGLDNDTWLFALDMGLGKTKIALDVFTVRKAMREAKRLLVTCPPIVMSHWAKEVAKHSGHSVALVDGTPAEKYQVFAYATTDIIVVSHTWLTRLFTEALKEDEYENLVDDKLYDEVMDACTRFDMLVIDEAQALTNPESKGFAGYDEFLAETPLLYELTGTPTGNNYLGVWSLYYLLDFGATYTNSFKIFIKKWFYTVIVGKGRRGFPINRLKKNMEQDFFDRFWTRAIRWEEAECNDLPEKEYIPLSLTMTTKQRELYDKVLNKPQKGNSDDDQGSIWELMRITGGVHKDLVGTATPSVKLEALGYIIDEIVINQADQLVIWHWLNLEGDLITKWLKKKYKSLKIGEARSGITKTAKDKALVGWADGTVNVFVANPKSLGIGVDLFEARATVYYSNAFSLLARNQSEKRIHRLGQDRRCLYFDLYCDGTVDEFVLDRLDEAQDAFVGLTRDKAWKMIRDKRK